jgi:hypothetical protein
MFRLGKCSVVLSRLYGLIILILFTIFCGYYLSVRPTVFDPLSPYHTPIESKTIDATWPDFLKDCGGEVIIENFVHARTVFNQKYESNIVSWSGYYTDAKRNPSLPFIGNEHALNLMVRMSPSESALYPDLVLSIHSRYLAENKAMFDSLKKGDGIRFKAKGISLGNEFKMHHYHGLEVEKSGEFKNLSEI